MPGKIEKLGAGVDIGTDEVAERGTAEFYREQATRLTRIAADTRTPDSKLELLEMAAVFLRLAERLVANRNSLGASDAETA